MDYGVKLVVEATGTFRDPVAPVDAKNGSVRGHLEGGAEKVIVSAPFKLSSKSALSLKDIVTVVMGINEQEYDHSKHHIISGASCTTTCLAHMVKPLLEFFGSEKIISASMDTVHSSTGTQAVLDRLPKTGATDLRKFLDEHNFPYTYRESEGGHTWANWRLYLSELAPLLFK